jgi:Domain of unknown function (DUF4365)
MKKRNRNAKQGRAGIIAVEGACNRLDLIWRNLLEEDVGVDGTIEISLGDFPTGKIVAAQVKSGPSYIRSERADSFRYYPAKGDVEYWRALSIPLFILVHHPADDCIYWVDFSRQVVAESDRYISFSKADRLDAAFEAYLRSHFDLTVHTDVQYAELQRDLTALVHVDGSSGGEVSISGLDLFVEGLWGLCSKLQFHVSLLSDLIRKAVREREGTVPVTYTFARTALYPFFTRYIGLLTKHHLAMVDVADVSESLYAKLEYPTFIAPLTTNGRSFVEYLRRVGVPRIHDNQFMGLYLPAHVQIDVYSSFGMIGGEPAFGPYTDVLAIRFNAYLDYYHLAHWRRASPDRQAVEVASQNIHYFGLIDYISNTLGSLPKDNILLRHRDIPLSPLICWLEAWYGHPDPMPVEELRGKSGKELAGFSDEVLAIMSPVGVVTVQEPPEPLFPDPQLLSGEDLRASLPARGRG